MNETFSTQMKLEFTFGLFLTLRTSKRRQSRQSRASKHPRKESRRSSLAVVRGKAPPTWHCEQKIAEVFQRSSNTGGHHLRLQHQCLEDGTFGNATGGNLVGKGESSNGRFFFLRTTTVSIYKLMNWRM